VPVKIIISGLTAAGKTTHGRLLAAAWDVPYYSMVRVMGDVLAREWPALPTGRWTPDRDLVRRDHPDVDLLADQRMVRLAETTPAGVFDAWALPWLYDRDDAVRLWLESDLPSRIRKYQVSQLPLLPDDEAVRGLLAAKDGFARARFAELYGFDLYTDRRPFDLTADNSHHLPVATADAARTGVAAFHRELLRLFESPARPPRRTDPSRSQG
jgi:cytidylate kinase